MNLKYVIILFLFCLSFSLLLASCTKKTEIVYNNISNSCSINEADSCSENATLNETGNTTIKYVFNVSMGVEQPAEQEEEIIVEQVNETPANETFVDLHPENSLPAVLSFKRVDGPICTSYGKPIITMFGQTTCPYCNSIKEVYLAALQPYIDNGTIVAKIWELDIKTNILNESDFNYNYDYAMYFQKYSYEKVPFFNFGCRYIRLGIAFDTADKEQKEFKAVIENLLFQLNNK